MKGVDVAIYELISNSGHVQAIMGVSSKEAVNVYPYNPNADIEIPSITFYESQSEAYRNIPKCELLTYKIDIWTESLEQSTRLGTVIDEMLSVRNQINPYANVHQFTLFTSADIFEQQTGIFHKSLTYKIIATNLEAN